LEIKVEAIGILVRKDYEDLVRAVERIDEVDSIVRR